MPAPRGRSAGVGPRRRGRNGAAPWVIGIALAPGADAWKVVRRAEALGFSHAWFYDTQMLCADVFVAMAAAAVQTSRIRLGTGVIIPPNRIAPVPANALASLNRLVPGRIIFGVGTGHTGRRTMGLGPMKLGALREYVRVIKAFLRQELVEWEFESARRKIRFLNPDLELINTTDPIPIHVSAFGPKARALAAEIAEGWINFATSVSGAIQDARSMAEAWRDAGRAPAQCYMTGLALGCVLADGEAPDSPRARAQAGPVAVDGLHGLTESGLGRKPPGGWRNS